MALGLVVTGLTHQNDGEKLWTLDSVSWWDEMELIQDGRFKKLDLGPDKLVYEAVLGVPDIRDLNNKYKKSFLEVFDQDQLVKPYYQQRKKQVDDLESRLDNPELRFVHIWIFDWDY